MSNKDEVEETRTTRLRRLWKEADLGTSPPEWVAEHATAVSAALFEMVRRAKKSGK